MSPGVEDSDEEARERSSPRKGVLRPGPVLSPLFVQNQPSGVGTTVSCFLEMGELRFR